MKRTSLAGFLLACLFSNSVVSLADADIQGRLYLRINDEKYPAETLKVTMTCLNDCTVPENRQSNDEVVLRDEANKPLVTIGTSIREGNHLTTYSDIFGNFFFDNLRPGRYRLEVWSGERKLHSSEITVTTKDLKKNLGEISVRNVHLDQNK